MNDCLFIQGWRNTLITFTQLDIHLLVMTSLTTSPTVCEDSGLRVGHNNLQYRGPTRNSPGPIPVQPVHCRFQPAITSLPSTEVLWLLFYCRSHQGRWTSRERTLRWWHLTSTWGFTRTINWTGLITLQLHKRTFRADSICWGSSGPLESFALLITLYDTVVASAIFYGLVCKSSRRQEEIW